MSDPKQREPEPDFSDQTRTKRPRPAEWGPYPANGCGPDDDAMIEAEFYGHAEAFGIPDPRDEEKRDGGDEK